MLEICLVSVFNLKGKYQKKLYHLQINECDLFFLLAKWFGLISNTLFLQMLSV